MAVVAAAACLQSTWIVPMNVLVVIELAIDMD